MRTLIILAIGVFLLAAGVIAGLIALSVASAEQARATQAAASAAAVASTSQALATVAIVLLVIAVLALLVLAGYLYLRLRRAEDVQRGRWAPGPNALWRRAGEEPDFSQALQGLVTLEILRALRDLRHPPPTIQEQNALALFEDDWWRR